MFFVYSGTEDARIDTVIAEIMGISRSDVQKLITQGKVKVDELVMEKKSFNLEEGMKVEVESDEQDSEISYVVPENIPLNIVFEDDFLMVINKPAGMVVHPGAGVKTGTVANALAYYFQNTLATSVDALGNPLRPGIVHRLDKGTSGLLVIAKTKEVHMQLSEAFEKRNVHKKYLTLVFGMNLPVQGSVEAPITRDSFQRLKMTVSNKPIAKYALTHFDVLVAKSIPDLQHPVSLLDVEIVTGRTHQIRVHLASIGYPVVGDETYGAQKLNQAAYRVYQINHPFLHSYQLAFTHPVTNKKLVFHAALPEELSGILEKMGLEKQVWEDIITVRTSDLPS